MPKHKYLQITLRYPNEASYQEAKEHAKSALEYWGGQYHPDDPLFPSRDLKVIQMKGIQLPVKEN